jgi:group I intron endonuclease
MGCVYVVINKINGKPYVGKTIGSLRKRRNGHESDARQGSRLYFHNALRKYGFDAFSWHEICSGDVEKELSQAEQSSIQFFSSLRPNGYNLTTGGEGNSPVKEVREKISKSLQGHSVSPETRAKVSKSLMGRKCPEHSKRMTGRVPSARSRIKVADALMGKPKSKLARAHMKIAYENRSDEAKENTKAGLRTYNKKRAEEGITEGTRKKMRESHLGKKQSEETKAKKNAKLKGRKKSPETVARMKEAWKKRRLANKA